MEKEYMFQIRDLNVFHDKKKPPVLSVPALDIPFGKMVFVLGVSGSGKTTLVEALGLMNKNFDEKKSGTIVFTPDPSSDSYDYKDLWANELNTIELRRKYFGFMFQNTYMLRDLTIEQNVAITAIIDNKTIEESLESAGNRLKDLLLKKRNDTNNGSKNGSNDNDEMIEDISERFPYEISGGQGQRSAFARAVVAEGCVLVADEPTGNVGKEDSNIVIKTIKNTFCDPDNENTKNNTAIIVSHNIDLALEHADIIIIIQNNHYILENEKIDINEKLKEISREDLKIEIHSKMKNSSDKEIKKDPDIPKISEPYDREQYSYDIKFKDNVFKDFFGKICRKELNKNRNYFILFFGLVFLVLGGVKGSLIILQDKMENPFMNSFPIEIPYGKGSSITELMDFGMKPAFLDSFDINSISRFHTFYIYVYNKNKNGNSVAFGRTMEFQKDPLYHEIGKKEGNERNLLKGSLFLREDDIGVVVSKDFIEDYGYADEKGRLRDAYIHIPMSVGDSYVLVPLPIKGVVKSIPGNNQIITTPYLYHMRFRDSVFSPSKAKEVSFFIPGDKKLAEEVGEILRGFIESDDNFNNLNYKISINEPQDKYKSCIDGNIVKAIFKPPLDYDSYERIAQKVLESKRKYNVTRLYTFPIKSGKDIDFSYANSILIHTKGLSKIDSLSVMLKDNFELPIDMANVRSSKNYKFVSTLTTILSIALGLFSIFIVILSVGNALRNHLHKNRMAIGLLLAFGVKIHTLKNIYINGMLKSLGLYIGISLSGAVIFGSGLLIILYRFYELEVLSFDLLSYYPIFMVIFFTLTYWKLNSTAKVILNYCPGDLLYGRVE